MGTPNARTFRIVERRAKTFLRKAKRRGLQVNFINNCGDAFQNVWAMRMPFNRGIGPWASDFDVERITFYIPRQYDEGGNLLFPWTKSNGENEIGLYSRLYDTEQQKLYTVERVFGDAESISLSAVIGLECAYRTYDPFKGAFPWNPSLVSTTLWLDASDSNTITSSGGLVSEWRDKSGNNYHARQSTDSQKPETGTRTINSLNALEFANDNLEFTGPLTVGNQSLILAVCNFTAAAGGVIVDFTQSGTSRWALGIQQTTNAYAYWSDGGGVPATFTVPDPTGETLIGGYRDENTIAIGTGGSYTTAPDTFSTPTFNTWLVGADFDGNEEFDGYLGEVVVMASYDLTTRQKIEGYLAWKWGLESSLPAGHPYKDAPPYV